MSNTTKQPQSQSQPTNQPEQSLQRQNQPTLEEDDEFEDFPVEGVFS